MEQTLTVNSFNQFIKFLSILNLLAIGSWGIIEFILGVYWRILLRQNKIQSLKSKNRIIKGIFIFIIVVIIFWLRAKTYEPEFTDYYPPYIE